MVSPPVRISTVDAPGLGVQCVFSVMTWAQASAPGSLECSATTAAPMALLVVHVVVAWVPSVLV